MPLNLSGLATLGEYGLNRLTNEAIEQEKTNPSLMDMVMSAKLMEHKGDRAYWIDEKKLPRRIPSMRVNEKTTLEDVLGKKHPLFIAYKGTGLEKTPIYTLTNLSKYFRNFEGKTGVYDPRRNEIGLSLFNTTTSNYGTKRSLLDLFETLFHEVAHRVGVEDPSFFYGHRKEDEGTKDKYHDIHYRSGYEAKKDMTKLLFTPRKKITDPLPSSKQ